MYIINADDYGISEDNNQAILEASKFGILKSTSVISTTKDCVTDEQFRRYRRTRPHGDGVFIRAYHRHDRCPHRSGAS